MIIVKKVAEHVIVMNEDFEVKMNVPNAKFKVVGDTIVITQNDEKVMELPRGNTAVLYK